jgi:hypothetical protein
VWVCDGKYIDADRPMGHDHESDTGPGGNAYPINAAKEVEIEYEECRLEKKKGPWCEYYDGIGDLDRVLVCYIAYQKL